MADLTLIISKESTHPNSYLWGPINNSGNNGQILEFCFSFKDAALQVLMSVCPFVSKLKFYLLTAFNIAECSRMFQTVPECMQNVPECKQNVPECMQNVMQLHKLVCSSFLCLSSSQEFRNAC